MALPTPQRVFTALLATLLPLTLASPAGAADVTVPPWTGTITVERTMEGNSDAGWFGRRETATYAFGALLSGSMNSTSAAWRQTVSYTATYEEEGGGSTCSDGETPHSYSARGSASGTTEGLVEFRSPTEYLVSAAGHVLEDQYTVTQTSSCPGGGHTFTAVPIAADTLHDGSWDTAAEPLAPSVSGTASFKSQFDYKLSWSLSRDGDADDDGVADGYDPCPLDPTDACAPPRRGTITIRTDTTPDGSTQVFDYTSNVPALNGRLSDGQSMSATVDAGTYSVTQTRPSGWVNEDITCSDGDSFGSAGEATIAVAAGENVTCAFTNRQLINDTLTIVASYGQPVTFLAGGAARIGPPGVDGAIVLASEDLRSRIQQVCLMPSWTGVMKGATSSVRLLYNGDPAGQGEYLAGPTTFDSKKQTVTQSIKPSSPLCANGFRASHTLPEIWISANLGISHLVLSHSLEVSVYLQGYPTPFTCPVAGKSTKKTKVLTKAATCIHPITY